MQHATRAACHRLWHLGNASPATSPSIHRFRYIRQLHASCTSELAGEDAPTVDALDAGVAAAQVCVRCHYLAVAKWTVHDWATSTSAVSPERVRCVSSLSAQYVTPQSQHHACWTNTRLTSARCALLAEVRVRARAEVLSPSSAASCRGQHGAAGGAGGRPRGPGAAHARRRRRPAVRWGGPPAAVPHHRDRQELCDGT